MCDVMLEHVATVLTRTRRVTLLADRGCRDRDWARTCRSRNWDDIIRIANNTTIPVADGRSVTAKQLGIKPGQRRYLPRVRLTLQADWECNLAITWSRAAATCPAELRVVLTNLHADGGCCDTTSSVCTLNKAFVTTRVAALTWTPHV